MPIAKGGTGQVTQQAAINALTGTQSSGKVLRSDGTNATLSAIQVSDVPILNQNTTGNAATATNVVGGAAGSVPYQTASGTTAMLATGSGVLVGGATPSYSTSPTLTGTNFTDIPNVATTATNANTALSIVSRDASGNFSAGTITANLTGSASLNQAFISSPVSGDIVTTSALGQTQDSGKIFITDASFSSPTDNQIPTALAVQQFVANATTSSKSFRGSYDASANSFPATGGSGVAGAIIAGDTWSVTVAGTLGGTSVFIGNTVLALINTPGQTSSNWLLGITGVNTFNGRGGAVSPQTGDYTIAQITNGLSNVATSGSILVGSSGGVATPVAMSGDATISNAGAVTLNTVPIAKGGTGATAQQAAINALTGTQSSGRYLRSDGTNATLSAIQAGDVPTLNQNTTGSAANIAGGLAGTVAYQSGVNTTSFTTVATVGQVLTSAGSAAPTWKTATSTPTANAIAQWDSNVNMSANTFLNGIQTVVSTGGITQLTVASPMNILVTGTLAHTVKLPDPSITAIGTKYYITNNSTAVVTVQKFDGTSFIPNGISTQSTNGLQLFLNSGSGFWNIIQKEPTIISRLANYVVLPTKNTAGTIYTQSFTVSYTGSQLLIQGSFSVFALITNGLRSFTLYYDNNLIDNITFYFNNINVHTTIPINSLINNVTSGLHTLRLDVPLNTFTNQDDTINLVLTESTS